MAEALQAPAGELDEVLLERPVAERVLDLVVVQRAVGAVGAHEELAVALRERGRDARVGERRAGEIAEHRLVGRQLHRPGVIGLAPLRGLRLVALRAGRLADVGGGDGRRRCGGLRGRRGGSGPALPRVPRSRRDGEARDDRQRREESAAQSRGAPGFTHGPAFYRIREECRSTAATRRRRRRTSAAGAGPAAPRRAEHSRKAKAERRQPNVESRRPVCYVNAAPRGLTGRCGRRRLRLRRRQVPLVGRHHLRRVRVLHVRGRHDLHAVLVEHVQHVAVELGVGLEDQQRLGDVHVQLVLDAEVVELQLQHERRRVGLRAGRPAGRLEQHRLHLPPRRFVADARDGVQDHAARLRELRCSW